MNKKVLSVALLFVFAFCSLFAIGGKIVFADDSSFNAECSIFYDIESDQTDFNNTGIKVKTKDINLAIVSEYGIEINGTKYPATSPLLNGYYIVEINGLTASTVYKAKPYYKKSSDSSFVYAQDYSFETDSGYTIKTYPFTYDRWQKFNCWWYTKDGATASFGHGTANSDSFANGWDVCGFDASGNQIRTTDCSRGWVMTCKDGDTVYTNFGSGSDDLVDVKVRLCNGKVDVWRVSQISEDGNLVTVKYYVRNISESQLSDFSFGAHAWVSVEEYNKNSSHLEVTKTEYGVNVDAVTYKQDGTVTYGKKYVLALNEGYCDVPVSSIWIGNGSDFYKYSSTGNPYPNFKYTFENSDNYFESRGTGYGGATIAYSWQNINLAPGEIKEFSVSSGASDDAETLTQAVANLSGITLKNSEETALTDGTIIKNTYNGTDSDHFVVVKEGKSADSDTTIEIKSNGKVKIGDNEYIAGDKGAIIVFNEKGISLTKGSINLSTVGETIKIDGKTITNNTNISVIVGANETSGGYITIPSKGAVVFDNIYQNNGTKDITITFDNTDKTTLNIPNNGSITISDEGNAETYNVGKKGAIFICDADGKKIISGSVWLDIDQSIKIGNKSVQNNYNDTIIVNSTDENSGYFTIPSKGEVTIGGNKIYADKDASVIVDNNKTTITTIEGGSIVINGKKIVENASNETIITIDNDGKIVVSIKKGGSAIVRDRVIVADAGVDTVVTVDSDCLIVTIPAGKSITIDKNIYKATTSGEAKIMLGVDDSNINSKLIWGEITLDKGGYIQACTNANTITNTSENNATIVVSSHGSGKWCTINVPLNGSFSAGNNTAKNISENGEAVTFEIDEKGNVSANGLLNQQTALINGKIYRGLDLSEISTGDLNNGYNADINIPKDSAGNPFKVYSIYFSGNSFNISTQKGGKFSNGVCGSESVSSITTTSDLTSVQYTVNDNASMEDVKADLSSVTYKGAGTVSITAAQYKPKGKDVYYNGHYYRLSSKTSDWQTAMNQKGDTGTYEGYKSHPVTSTTDDENKMLITLLEKCRSADSANARIWLGAVPSGANSISSKGIPNVGYTSGLKEGKGTGWKWIWDTPESKKELPSGTNFWSDVQPDGSSAAPSYVVYLGFNNTTQWDDLSEGNATTGTLSLAYYVTEYSPYDSDSKEWVYDSDGNSATSGFSNVQSVSRTYDSSNVGQLNDGQTLNGYSGKVIENPKDSSNDIISITSDKTNKKDTITIPFEGGKVVIDSKEFTTKTDNTKIEITSDGTISLVQGAVILDNGETIKVGNKIVSNTSKEIVVNANGEVTIPSNCFVKIGDVDIASGTNNSTTANINNNNIIVTIPSEGKAVINNEIITSGEGNETKATISNDGTLTVSLSQNGETVDINGVEYTAEESNTQIKITTQGNSLTQGAIILDDEETINVGAQNVIVRAIGNKQIIVTKKNDGTYWAKVPANGSFSAGNNKFVNTNDSLVEIEIGADGTLVLPKGVSGEVSGKIKVTTTNGENEKEIIVEIPNDKSYVYNDETEMVDGLKTGDKITIGGLVKTIGEDGSISLNNNEKLEGDDEITVSPTGSDVSIYVKNPTTSGYFEVLIPETNNGNTTVTKDEVTISKEGDIVEVNQKQYKAGKDGATFSFNENGELILTDGSTEIDNGDTIGVDVGGQNIDITTKNDEGTTITKTTITKDNENGTSTVSVDGEGTIDIGGAIYKTGESGAEFIINNDGNTQLSNGSAIIEEGKSINANISGTTVSISSSNDDDETTTIKTTVTADKENGTISISGKGAEVKIGDSTYQIGDAEAEFTVDENGKGSLTGGSIDITNGKSISVGEGKTIVTNNGDTSISVSVDEEGTGTLSIPSGKQITVGDATNGVEITADENNTTNVSIDANGKTTVDIPNNGAVKVAGKTISGSNDSNTKVEIATNGSVAVITPTTESVVKINNTEYTTNAENTKIEITSSGLELVSGGVVLDSSEDIAVNGTLIKNETDPSSGKTVTVSVDENGGNIAMDNGGKVTIGENGDAKTIECDQNTQISISTDDVTTITTPTTGSKVNINDTEYTTNAEDTKIEITSNGLELVSGGVVLDSSEDIAVNGTLIKNETDPSSGKTVTVSVDENGGNIAMDNGGKVTIGENGDAKTIECDKNTQISISTDDVTTITTPTTESVVKINNTEYTTNAENTKIEITSSGLELVSGGVVLGGNKDIIVNGTIIENITENKTVDIKMEDDESGKKQSNITISDGGSIKIGDTTIKGAEGTNTQILVDEQGDAIVTIPEGKTIEVGGKAISGGNGTKVSIDQFGEVTVITSSAEETVKIGDVEYVTTKANTEIRVTENGNNLVSGGVKIDGTNTIICGNNKVIQKPAEETGEITITIDENGKENILVSGNGSVSIDNSIYTVGNTDTTFVVDDSGVQIKQGSVTLDSNVEVKVGDISIDNKTGKVTIEGNEDGSGRVIISDDGSVEINNKTITGNVEIAIDTDGKATLDVGAEDNAVIDGVSLDSGKFTIVGDGIIMGEGACITGSDGVTKVKGVAKDSSDTKSKETKIETNTNGNITLIEGKAEVRGGTIYVNGDSDNIAVTIPSEKTYIVDADNGIINGINSGDNVKIGGVTYTSGRENGSFSINDTALSTGDKAIIPADVEASISISDSDSSPSVVVSNGNNSNIEIIKTDNGVNLKISEDGDKFTIGGKTYMAGNGGATFDIDDKGKVSLTDGTVKIEDSNKAIIIGDSTFKTGSNGASITSEKKVINGSVQFDKDSEVRVGNTSTLIRNTGDTTLEVASNGDIIAPNGSKIDIEGKVYQTNEETILNVDNNGNVNINEGSVEISNNATIIGNNGKEIKNSTGANITIDVDKENKKDNIIVSGNGGKVVIDDAEYEASQETTLTVNEDGKVSIQKGSVKITEGTSINGISGKEIKMPTESNGNINIVTDSINKKDTITISDNGGKVIIDGTTYTAESTGTTLSIDENGTTTLTSGTISTTEKEKSIVVGDNIYTTSDKGAKITSDGKIVGGSVEFGKENNIVVGNNTITNLSDTNIVVDSEGNVSVLDKGKIQIGDTIYTSASDDTIFTVDANKKVNVTKGTAIVPGDKEILANGNVYTTDKDGATITSDGKIISGSVKFDKNNKVKVGENNIIIENISDKTVSVDKDGNIIIPNKGKVKIGSTIYTAENDETILAIDKDGKVSIIQGSTTAPKNKTINVGENTYITDNNRTTITSDGKVTAGSVKFDKDNEVKISDKNVVIKNDGDTSVEVDSDGNVDVPNGGLVVIGNKKYTTAGSDGVKFKIDNDGNVKIIKGAATTNDGKTQIAKDGTVVGGSGNTIKNSDEDNREIVLTTSDDGKDYIKVSSDGKIVIADKEYENNGNTTYVVENGNTIPSTIVSGVDGSVRLVVTKQEEIPELIKTNIKRHELSSTIYDIKLLNEENVEVQPDGSLKIKLLIPELLGNKTFRITHLHNGELTEMEYIIEGDYAVFSVDNLSEFTFIIDNSGSAWWLILILALILMVELILIFIKNNQIKKGKKKNIRLAGAVFGGVIPISEIVLLALLSVMVVALGVYLVYLYKKERKMLASAVANNTLAIISTNEEQKIIDSSVEEKINGEETTEKKRTISPKSETKKVTPKENKVKARYTINIDKISANFSSGATVTLTALKSKGLVPKKEKAIKILARGKLNKPLIIIADSFSTDAVKIIVQAGGKAIIGNR